MVRCSTATLAVCMTLASVALAAQTPTTVTIMAHAEVGPTLTVSNPTAIDYGALLPGGVSANVPAAFSATIPHAGSIQVNSSNGTLTVDVTIEKGDQLSLLGLGQALTTTLSCGLGASATDANTTSIACRGQNLGVASNGTVWIFVGGQTSAPPKAKFGVYRGTVTVRLSLTSS